MNTKKKNILSESVVEEKLFKLSGKGMSFFFELMDRLQKDREKTYHDSWCRRGEIFSIYPNTARKWDRLEGIFGSPEEVAFDTLFDTWIDLGVYCGLWLTYDTNNPTVRRFEFSQLTKVFGQLRSQGSPIHSWVYPISVSDLFVHMRSRWDQVEGYMDDRIKQGGAVEHYRANERTDHLERLLHRVLLGMCLLWMFNPKGVKDWVESHLISLDDLDFYAEGSAKMMEEFHV